MDMNAATVLSGGVFILGATGFRLHTASACPTTPAKFATSFDLINSIFNPNGHSSSLVRLSDDDFWSSLITGSQ